MGGLEVLYCAKKYACITPEILRSGWWTSRKMLLGLDCYAAFFEKYPTGISVSQLHIRCIGSTCE
jgi:hypothetical protein